MSTAVAEYHRGIQHDRGRVEAFLERGRIDERLEAGAGLTPCLGGAVELVAGKAVATNDGLDGPVAGIQRNQRSLAAWNLVDYISRGRVVHHWCLATRRRLGCFALDACQVTTLEQRGRVLASPFAGRGRQGDFAGIGKHHGHAAIVVRG